MKTFEMPSMPAQKNETLEAAKKNLSLLLTDYTDEKPSSERADGYVGPQELDKTKSKFSKSWWSAVIINLGVFKEMKNLSPELQEEIDEFIKQYTQQDFKNGAVDIEDIYKSERVIEKVINELC